MSLGRVLKEDGQQLALFNAGESWLNETLDKLRLFCSQLKQAGRKKFRMEEFRAAGPTLGVTEPASHKAWGALPQVATRAGIIRWSGEHEPATSKKTHAHYVKTWIPL